ncbi:MAG: zinc-ribbon domain containing protein [Candidatus Accumulibacter sp.]|uniref:zinc-ribbon domain containing protein n=1 Tax=Accumulibacter sp. TaxID=2053492 RepID=UPI00287AE3B5|nr:zinc-ribbon domain containing protein [Accumulibacter sp.]MDS4014876.1 zinc-ribbon domain containing protein [Accumulibacter sp.]
MKAQANKVSPRKTNALRSGKQRRAEIIAARRRRKTLRLAADQRQSVDLRPPGSAAVSPALLRPYNSYGEPEFVRRGYYTDLAFRCVDCGAAGIWRAERQKWWYEVAAGDVFSTAVRCAACRARERARKAAARQAQIAGQRIRNSSALADVAEGQRAIAGNPQYAPEDQGSQA